MKKLTQFKIRIRVRVRVKVRVMVRVKVMGRVTSMWYDTKCANSTHVALVSGDFKTQLAFPTSSGRLFHH